MSMKPVASCAHSQLLNFHASEPQAYILKTELDQLFVDGALHVVSRDLQYPILRSYIRSRDVQPQIPVVDPSEFLEVFNGIKLGSLISLFVWQALTAASIFFLAEAEITTAGFLTRHEAADTFLLRVKLCTYCYPLPLCSFVLTD
jgi:hypothetical protein